MSDNNETARARRRLRSRPGNDKANQCVKCGGPCRAYAGTLWGWTCVACQRKALSIDDARQVLPMGPDRSQRSIENALRL